MKTAILLLVASVAGAQVCRLSVAGLNRDRRVLGPVHTECPGDPFHSAPFGNWGATSNFGGKINGHQFDGWCHDVRVCDNNANCRNACRDGWYEWNSCTDVREFSAPNCDLFNDKDCTAQKSTLGVNVMSTQTVDIPVRCPLDTNLDGQADQGGCRDVAEFDPGANFISLYELDPVAPDQLVQTLYFPKTPVKLNCVVLACGAAGSEWVAPSGYADPVSPAKVHAELAAVVNSGLFVNVNNACPLVQTLLRNVSAASFREGAVAPESLVTAFGAGLSALSLRVRDAANVERPATLFYTSGGQVNYLMPAGSAAGLATVTGYSGPQAMAVGAIEIARVAPGVFTANASGVGVAAALALRVVNGERSIALVYGCNSTAGCTALPIDVSHGEVFLELYGTGIRGASANVEVRVAGTPVDVLYAGPQPQFAGLDQINVRLPATLAGRGDVELLVTAAGIAANPVTLRIQ